MSRARSDNPCPNPPSPAELRRADAKIAKQRAEAARIPTLDEPDERGNDRDDNAHKTATALRCNGPAGPYCDPMREVLHDEVNSNRTGFTAIVHVHYEWNRNGTHCGIAFKRPKHRHIMLNTCPWCGQGIAAKFPVKPANTVGPLR